MKKQEMMRPAVNVKRKEDCIDIFVALPGVKKEHISLDVEDSILVVETKEVDEEVKYNRQGFNFRGIKWRFSIPSKTNVNQIGAELDNGVLHIVLPQVVIKREISLT